MSFGLACSAGRRLRGDPGANVEGTGGGDNPAALFSRHAPCLWLTGYEPSRLDLLAGAEHLCAMVRLAGMSILREVGSGATGSLAY